MKEGNAQNGQPNQPINPSIDQHFQLHGSNQSINQSIRIFFIWNIFDQSINPSMKRTIQNLTNQSSNRWFKPSNPWEKLKLWTKTALLFSGFLRLHDPWQISPLSSTIASTCGISLQTPMTSLYCLSVRFRSSFRLSSSGNRRNCSIDLMLRFFTKKWRRISASILGICKSALECSFRPCTSIWLSFITFSTVSMLGIDGTENITKLGMAKKTSWPFVAKKVNEIFDNFQKKDQSINQSIDRSINFVFLSSHSRRVFLENETKITQIYQSKKTRWPIWIQRGRSTRVHNVNATYFVADRTTASTKSMNLSFLVSASGISLKGNPNLQKTRRKTELGSSWRMQISWLQKFHG